MTFHISIAGKGGTGKTTLAALVIRYLIERGKTPVLAVDADPNANLDEALGFPKASAIADVLAVIKDPKAVPPGMTKDLFIEYKLNSVLNEGDKVDLLVMGGPEGPGCYCFANDLLRRHMERISGNYPFLVMDNEAGLEHLSRRVAQDVQILLVTSDPTIRGLKSAARIYSLARALDTKIERSCLILTRASEDETKALEAEIRSTGMEFAGWIPFDPQVGRYDLEGKPAMHLPESSVAVSAVFQIMKRLGL